MKFLFLILFFLSSCVEKKEITHSYLESMEELKKGNYHIASDWFEKIEDNKPFTEEGVNSLIMSAYSYYKAGEHEESLRVIDYFLRANPVNKNIPYVYYLKAINYESQITNVQRAKNITEQALNNFQNLVNKFPNSPYKDDSLKRISNLIDDLVRNDLLIGDFYLNEKNYIGALNHYKSVLKYTTKYKEDAMKRIIEINNILNLKIEAARYYALLIEEFPNTDYKID